MSDVNYNYTIKSFWVNLGARTIYIPKASFILGVTYQKWSNQFKVSVIGDWSRPVVERAVAIYGDGEKLQPHHNLANYKGMVDTDNGLYFLFVD